MAAGTFHMVMDPKPGQVVELLPGSRLGVTFKRRVPGAGRWRVEARPDHLVSLVEGRYYFQFLVFGNDDGEVKPLRLVRSWPGSEEPYDTRELIVVPKAG